jgi:hypothetical protein
VQFHHNTFKRVEQQQSTNTRHSDKYSIQDSPLDASLRFLPFPSHLIFDSQHSFSLFLFNDQQDWWLSIILQQSPSKTLLFKTTIKRRTMKLSVPFLVAIAAIPSATCFVSTASANARSSVTSLQVSVGSQLTPPKKVEDLSETSEDLYNQNVQTTYGYVYLYTTRMIWSEYPVSVEFGFAVVVGRILRRGF